MFVIVSERDIGLMLFKSSVGFFPSFINGLIIDVLKPLGMIPVFAKRIYVIAIFVP